MASREDRQRRAAEWLAQLQAWKTSGSSMSAYAKLHGLALCSAYQWRRVLARRGVWHEEATVTQTEARVLPRFARVTVTDSPQATLLIVRVQLANGRQLSIELGDVAQLSAVLGALECPG